MSDGYTPIGKLDMSNSPQGGSGVIARLDRTIEKIDFCISLLDKIIDILEKRDISTELSREKI